MSLTIDSFAWIELIRGTELGVRSRSLIDAAGSSYTPAIVVAEVAYRCARDGMEPRLVRQELRSISEASQVVPTDIELATTGSTATLELRGRARARRLSMPGLGDGLVLATARKFGTSILTGDPHFHGLRETVWLGGPR